MDFDPQQYKQTTRQQWEDAAEAWHRWDPTLDAWLAEATEAMLDGAGVGPAAACSTSRRAPAVRRIAAARRAGPDGRVLATDISPTILTYAAKRAADARAPRRDRRGRRRVARRRAGGSASTPSSPGSA